MGIIDSFRSDNKGGPNENFLARTLMMVLGDSLPVLFYQLVRFARAELIAYTEGVNKTSNVNQPRCSFQNNGVLWVELCALKKIA